MDFHGGNGLAAASSPARLWRLLPATTGHSLRDSGGVSCNAVFEAGTADTGPASAGHIMPGEPVITGCGSIVLATARDRDAAPVHTVLMAATVANAGKPTGSNPAPHAELGTYDWNVKFNGKYSFDGTISSRGMIQTKTLPQWVTKQVLPEAAGAVGHIGE
jgi:hypothetical protein